VSAAIVYVASAELVPAPLVELTVRDVVGAVVVPPKV
jgi:hypothetical protein